MTFGDVLYESKDRVATITLNRPERFNAISETMPDDIAAAFEHANNDDAVHVVVLTGAENAGANNPVGDKILKRIVTWAAGREPERFKKKPAKRPKDKEKDLSPEAKASLLKILGNSERHNVFGPSISLEKSWKRCTSDQDCVRVLSPCGMQHVIVNQASKNKAMARWKKTCGNKTPPAAMGRAPRPGCRKGQCIDLGSKGGLLEALENQK